MKCKLFETKKNEAILKLNKNMHKMGLHGIILIPDILNKKYICIIRHRR